MDTIRLATWIDAPVERCFLLSLSIDLHIASARNSAETAIDGVTTGLIGEGESVTFRGRHFGRLLLHTSRIDVLRPHSYFRDVMVSGSFRHFEHDHHFAAMDDGTRMRDEIRFLAPWGPVGRVLARKRLKAFLMERNAVIKRVAESEEWRQYLESRIEDRTAIPAKSEAKGRRSENVLLRGSQSVVVPGPPPN